MLLIGVWSCKGYVMVLEPAQMQLLAGRHLITELKAEGWSGLKHIILGAGEHILDGAVREI